MKFAGPVIQTIYKASTDTLSFEDLEDAIEFMENSECEQDEIDEFVKLIRILRMLSDCHYILQRPVNELPI